MKVIAAPGHVSIIEPHDLRASTASADEVAPGRWWICRVLVQREHRGQGLGTKLLRALVEECSKQGAKRIEVAPGGYDSDPKRQRAFYLKAGFEPEGDGELLVFKP